MPAYKDKDSGKWYAIFRYRNQDGENIQKLKRGFKTKKQALEY